ncbi:hypothetical protein NECAME_08737 [Necator americanus]|uniref:Uncharacterized protein n=1 Tax=Necator americanus TaxID=51031 RepID=W2TGA0_NECAM|nr:hypothetical protein NECAME_08737 [Necator americanus]ETN81075.1 hypothetical protein NECAME_08737 [Necator americanus]
MTINKVQGQSFNEVGLYFPEDLFSHGQLYVAFSRVRTPAGLKGDTKHGSVKNILYNEILREADAEKKMKEHTPKWNKEVEDIRNGGIFMPDGALFPSNCKCGWKDSEHKW